MEVIFTDHFLQRVEECIDYIALDHIPTAVKWAEGVFDHCQKCSQERQNRSVPLPVKPFLNLLQNGCI